MEWKLTGSEPVYQQLEERFRCAVLNGEYQPGARVPSVRELAVQARVNPNTMQRALSELEREGLLCSQGTAGRFVTVDQVTLDALRQRTVERTVAHCRQLLREVGLTLHQAADLAEKEEIKEG